ncbi:DUF3459 domain-containing protein [Antarcticibacterium sp. 1MA-6-2]|uniref:DUF3459 domain-containing protein n=1 Tax=Antarcticibacterium sp. 1MA-6-2 TaxID=2908210 RepID=UPI001F2629E6|nr:DUF3459 domain-containing protein [Antarcticibacterium sp. 1MA-6-2]UJH91812.1 DUF3459 domain-containing protein [Antarcticibacterium sp. 1MA-6-2]
MKRRNSFFSFYKKLLELRKSGAFEPFRSNEIISDSNEEKRLLTLTAEGEKSLFAAFNFSDSDQEVNVAEGSWQLLLASGNKEWGGTQEIKFQSISNNFQIPAHSFVLLNK